MAARKESRERKIFLKNGLNYLSPRLCVRVENDKVQDGLIPVPPTSENLKTAKPFMWSEEHGHFVSVSGISVENYIKNSSNIQWNEVEEQED